MLSPAIPVVGVQEAATGGVLTRLTLNKIIESNSIGPKWVICY